MKGNINTDIIAFLRNDSICLGYVNLVLYAGPVDKHSFPFWL